MSRATETNLRAVCRSLKDDAGPREPQTTVYPPQSPSNPSASVNATLGAAGAPCVKLVYPTHNLDPTRPGPTFTSAVHPTFATEIRTGSECFLIRLPERLPQLRILLAEDEDGARALVVVRSRAVVDGLLEDRGEVRVREGGRGLDRVVCAAELGVRDSTQWLRASSRAGEAENGDVGVEDVPLRSPGQSSKWVSTY